MLGALSRWLMEKAAPLWGAAFFVIIGVIYFTSHIRHDNVRVEVGGFNAFDFRSHNPFVVNE